MARLLGIFPVMALVLWILAIQTMRSRRTPASLRMSAMIASLLLGASLVACTEILSIFHLVTFGPVLSFWMIAVIAAVPFARGSWSATLPRLRQFVARTAQERILGSLVLFLLAALLWVVCVYPPQTYDSLSYHLPRQILWMQQGSVAPFDSPNFRSLSMTPFVEFIGLHFFVLTRADTWHTGVQWIFLILALCAISLMVKRLGGGRIAQWFAVLFAVTYPVVFFQASSAKNDLAAGALVTITTLLVLSRASMLPRFSCSILLGLSLGLSLLTKGNAYIFLAPVMLWMIVRFWRVLGLRCLPRLVVIFLLAALLNAGYWYRNFSVFNRPFGPPSGAETKNILVNQSHRPLEILSVVLRDLSSLNITPSDTINGAMQAGVEKLHQWMGISVNHPPTTFNEAYTLLDLFRSEDSITSVIHNVVALLGLWIAVIAWRKRRVDLCLAICIILGFLFFCAYLKWQLWLVRLLIPLLFLSAPLAAGILTLSRRHRDTLLYVASGLLFISVLPAFKGPRPVFSARAWKQTVETLRVGKDRHQEANNAKAIAEYIAENPDLKNIGIAGLHPNAPSYILMRPLIDYSRHPVRLWIVNPAVHVEGFKTPTLDAVISYNSPLNVEDQLTGRRFAAARYFSPLTFCLPAQTPALDSIPLIVSGRITADANEPGGKSVAVLSIDRVLKGQTDLSRIRVVTDLQTNRAAPVDPFLPFGLTGIWLLKPTEDPQTWRLQDGQHLLPESQLDTILKVLK